MNEQTTKMRFVIVDHHTSAYDHEKYINVMLCDVGVNLNNYANVFDKSSSI